MTPATWHAPAATGPMQAQVDLPGSKSLTNRFLVLAALVGGTSRLRAPLRSRDTLLMAAALRELGVGIEDASAVSPVHHPATSPDWIITPTTLRGGVTVECGLAGTVMRFLPPVASLAQGAVRFEGDEQARHRPMGPILTALRELQVSVTDEGHPGLPFTVQGKGSVRGGQVSLDASASSQFVSALLLAGPRFQEGITVCHDGPPLPSAPHVEMTVETLRDAGATVDDSVANRWRVEPGQLSALDVHVEPDLSNAAPFLAAALVSGGTVAVPGWPQHTTQAGDAIRDILDAMGADVRLSRDCLTVSSDGQPNGIDLDLHDASELTPVVAAIAALADSPSRLRGIAHIRGHETDRLAALATELSQLGSQVEVMEDGLLIRPAALRARPARQWHTYADHRMVMAGAILGLRVPGLVVQDPATVSKTLPGFTALWQEMLSPPQGTA